MLSARGSGSQTIRQGGIFFINIIKARLYLILLAKYPPGSQEYSLASPRKAEVETVQMRTAKAQELEALRSKVHTESEGLILSFLKNIDNIFS